MLELYFELPDKLNRLRQSPVGEHLDEFAAALHAVGYARRPGQWYLRAAAHLGHWASAAGMALADLDEHLVDLFVHHLAACTCPRLYRGSTRDEIAGTRLFVTHLRGVGVAPSLERKPTALPPLVDRFCGWMRDHRGVRESTLATYLPLIKDFVVELGDDPSGYDTSHIRMFLLSRTREHSRAWAKVVTNATRMFLRCLASYGLCSPDLVAVVPTFACWKLSALPRYLPAQDVERLVQACDPTTRSGSRDYAVVLLLARLGLRAGDVAGLRLADIDWQRGQLRVMGKGRRETWLPLPQDVGEAVLNYVDRGRPPIKEDHVFLRNYAPWGAFPHGAFVSKLVRRLLLRTGIKAPSYGAHVLRHSAATEMLRQGMALDAIGALLRHRSVDTTAHYAKVDVALLRSVAQPWPIGGE